MHNKPHPSNRAGWLLCCLSSCCHLVLLSSSCCATLSSSNRAGWLLHRLSLCHCLILLSRRHPHITITHVVAVAVAIILVAVNRLPPSLPSPRLLIPVFRNLFFGPKKPFLTGFLRISFFPAFSGGIFHRNVVLERLQEFLFFLFLQDFFAGIPVGQEFLYLPRNPPDSGGFLFPPKAAGSGQQLKKALC